MAMACAANAACEQSGGEWIEKADGGLVCIPAETTPQPTQTAPTPTENPPQVPPNDSSSSLDASSPFGCGNANPDPCICGRPKENPVAATLCAQEKTCLAHGGQWNFFVNVPTKYGTELVETCVGFDAGAPIIRPSLLLDASIEKKP
jgi:hypothetical protein